MESGPNLPSSSPILALVLMIVMAALAITCTKWFMMDPLPEDKALTPEAQKLVGRWEQPVKDKFIDMILDEDGAFRYALRESDRLDLHGTWKLEEGRLILHIDKVDAGSTFRAGDNVTLGPVLSVESRNLILGTEDEKITF